ncbi:DUF4260 domain-containing protein [Promineifilum sp.]|uniref:DUF4260 domain-containing protein n=1 Tax=Promineifilum sp. TaxID=2664178 RepID=UPI0035B4C8F4
MPRTLLHVEGGALLLAATAAYFRLGHPWWLYLLLLIAPDLSLLGYAAGPRVGAVAYNLVHTMVAPIIVLVAGWWVGSAGAVAVCLVWLAHLGMDRMLGLGLKYPDAGKSTHFDRL